MFWPGAARLVDLPSGNLSASPARVRPRRRVGGSLFGLRPAAIHFAPKSALAWPSAALLEREGWLGM